MRANLGCHGNCLGQLILVFNFTHLGRDNLIELPPSDWLVGKSVGVFSLLLTDIAGPSPFGAAPSLGMWNWAVYESSLKQIRAFAFSSCFQAPA